MPIMPYITYTLRALHDITKTLADSINEVHVAFIVIERV